MGTQLTLSRKQILAYRREVQGLNRRVQMSHQSLRASAWAGLQDSMPRAALLSIHARVKGTTSTILDDPSLIQVWGPRFSAYVIAKEDLAVFTLGRHPSDPKAAGRARDTAAEILGHLKGRTQAVKDISVALGGHPTRLRYATTTGTVTIRWDGARQPTITPVPAPDIEPHEAQMELARRYLHSFGPGTPTGFAGWAGITPQDAGATFGRLESSVTSVTTPIGEATMLTTDIETATGPVEAEEAVRLLPSGDTYYLLQGDDRGLLVPQPARQQRLWTSRVWPGALLVDGTVIGTWRRSKTQVSIEPWRTMSARTKGRVEEEAKTLPLPDEGPITVVWL